jgi:nucleoid DNA-binding protein
MAVTPPIDLRELAKKGVFDEDRFFRMLSENNNYVDDKTSRDFYMGLVRLITKELRKNGVLRLPHLGDFALVKQPDRIGWAGKQQGILEGKYSLKFYPKEAWRKYFSKLSEKTGREGALDPREKLLNRSL